MMSENHLHNAVAVGFSQGCPFALALAGRRLVEATAILSGQDELSHVSLAPRLHPDIAEMITAVRQDAWAFERHLSKIATPEVLFQLVIKMSSDRDRELYLADTFREAYRRSLRVGFSQGAQGYARDLVNTLGPSPVRQEDITVPVDLWYGGLDMSTGHSPDFGATLAARLPNARLTVDPAEGGSILWTRARDILERLASYLR